MSDSGRRGFTAAAFVRASWRLCNETSGAHTAFPIRGDFPMGDRQMKHKMSLALAAAVLLAGISSASAAGTMSKASSGSAATSSKMSSSAMASDSLNLTSAQRKTAWSDISKTAAAQTAPKGFDAKVGVVIPSSIKTSPVPVTTASDVPALRPYSFAMLQKKIVIVNPNDKKIAEVITR
jgi:hypothetical protein